MNVIVLEGARGGGKTTVAHLLRQSIEGSTLINMTGFKADALIGQRAISVYYDGMFNMLSAWQYIPDCTVILDRTFFSEAVYSKIYKHYSFRAIFESYLMRMALMPNVKWTICHLFVEDDTLLTERLTRDKVPLFGTIAESVAESRRQTREYDRVFEFTEDEFDLNSHRIPVDGLTPEAIKQIILAYADIEGR